MRFELVETPVSDRAYDDPILNGIIEEYRRRFDRACFVFPVGFMRFMSRVSQAAPGSQMWIIGDYGIFSDDDIREQHPLLLSRHEEFFSLDANFDALARYARKLGGDALVSPSSDRAFTVAALFTGAASDHARAREAFRAALEAPTLRDIARTLKAVRLGQDEIPSEYAIDALHLSNCDPRVFSNFAPMIHRLVPKLSRRQRRALLAALDRVRTHLYPIGISRDIPAELAGVYRELGRHDEAAALSRQPSRERGENVEPVPTPAEPAPEPEAADRDMERFLKDHLQVPPLHSESSGQF